MPFQIAPSSDDVGCSSPQLGQVLAFFETSAPHVRLLYQCFITLTVHVERKAHLIAALDRSALPPPPSHRLELLAIESVAPGCCG